MIPLRVYQQARAMSKIESDSRLRFHIPSTAKCLHAYACSTDSRKVVAMYNGARV
jgi:hypothetical protein